MNSLSFDAYFNEEETQWSPVLRLNIYRGLS